jgi:hypothetical protein
VGEPDGLLERLGHLVDAGHAIVLVGPRDHPAAGERTWAGRVDVVPDEPEPGAWYMTADPATCGDRRPDLRTVLVGPRSEGQRPTRCDTTARDVREAVLEILAADAMSG